MPQPIAIIANGTIDAKANGLVTSAEGPSTIGTMDANGPDAIRPDIIGPKEAMDHGCEWTIGLGQWTRC